MEGLVEDAFQHAMKADGPAAAATLLASHLNAIANAERWGWVESWLAMIPPPIIKQAPELLALNAVLLQSRGFYVESASLLDDVERLLAGRNPNGVDYCTLRAMVDTLRAGHMCYQGHAEKAIELLNDTREMVPQDGFAIRGYALLMEVISQCMCGRLNQARDIISAALAEVPTLNATHTYHARALMALAYLQWWTADVSGARMTGIEIRVLNEDFPVPECAAIARYFEGAALYDQCELEKAIEILVPVVHDGPINNVRFYIECGFILANAYNAQGTIHQAKETADLLVERMQHSGRKQLLIPALVCHADLAMRQGLLVHGAKWALSFEPDRPLLHNLQGAALLALGRLPEAKVWFAKASEQGHPEASANLGVVLWQLGEREEAVIVWRDMLAADPNNLLARQHLARVAAAGVSP